MDLQKTLRAQAEAWASRPLLRRLYREWYDELGEWLTSVPGETVELGSGIGTFKERFPFAIATDVEPTPWAEHAVEAEQLPYENGALANLVLVDVFHHLGRPARFLDEAVRTLAPGGRVLILDLYCSPLSTVAYRRFHPERTDLSADALEDDAQVAAAPLASNQARATLVFFREFERFAKRWPELALVERRRFAFVLYPLSGGFSRRQLAPASLYRPLAVLERAFRPLAPLAAFRCLVVLERRQELERR